MEISEVIVLIPAWQPEGRLVELVAGLNETGLRVLVINDGSNAECNAIFEDCRVAGATVIHHAVNLGKGRALKSGFNHVLTAFPEAAGVVTADADGQHTIQDILHVAQALASSEGRPVLGARSFGADVPFRSRFGNVLTRYIFGFVTGTKLIDTQTGLRGLPMPLLSELMRLDGERYEYEMTMLAHLCRTDHKPLEIPIQTVYIDNNRSSHFNPVRDSMRIYFVLARFYFSSIIAAGIDFLVFTLAFAVSHNVLLSVAVGRLSSLVNFALNRQFVFHNRGSVAGALWRYYLLVVFIAGLSYGLIRASTNYLHWNVFAAKFFIDIALSLLSFSVQRTFVFRRSKSL